MDKQVYILCNEYIHTMNLIYTLIDMDLSNRERLKLFRVSQERISIIEKDLLDTLLEKDIKEG